MYANTSNVESKLTHFIGLLQNKFVYLSALITFIFQENLWNSLCQPTTKGLRLERKREDSEEKQKDIFQWTVLCQPTKYPYAIFEDIS